MGIYKLDALFDPKTIAVIGCGKESEYALHRLMKNLSAPKHLRTVFRVCPERRMWGGRPCYPSVLSIPVHIDLAVIVMPVVLTISTVKNCIRAGVDSALIMSPGSENDMRGQTVFEAGIESVIAGGHMRIMGPGSMGIISNRSLLNASMADRMPLPGRMAFVSQSNAMCRTILDISFREGIGFSHIVGAGGMIDIDFGDLIGYLGNDSHVGSIVLFIEQLTRQRKFMSAARAVSRVKPIVALKTGISGTGAPVALARTGVHFSEDTAWRAAFERAGIVQVETIEELFDCAELTAKQSVSKGSGLAVVVNGNGPGAMTVDALAKRSMKPVTLSPDTVGKLNLILSPYWNMENPINISWDATPQRWRHIVEICLAASEIQALILIFMPHPEIDSVQTARAVEEVIRQSPWRPRFSVWMGGEGPAEARRLFNQAGIPTFETPERAVSAFVHLYSYARNLETLQEIPPKLSKFLTFDDRSAARRILHTLKRFGGRMTDAESRFLLKDYGIPVNPVRVAHSPDQAAQAALHMGYPVALKINSRDILHKTDAWAVALNLHDARAVRNAFEHILRHVNDCYPGATVEGITVEPMVLRADFELIMGIYHDPDFGPIIVFGAGGIFADISGDSAVALPPLNRLLARRLMEETRIYRMLCGYRKRVSANMELLEEMLIRLSQLAIDFPEISRVEMNPVILTGKQACVVDARAVLKPASVRSPLHLVISPYPDEFEAHMKTRCGMRLFMRPIKPEDAPLLVELMQDMSTRSIYYRFCRPMTSLPPRMLALFTQIDYDLDMALVALDDEEEEDTLLGVGRLIRYPGGTKAEFAVMVGDPWQGKGIGAALMKHLIAIAAQRGIEKLWGLVMAENTQMLALGKKLGFSLHRLPDAGQYELELDLRD